MIIEVEINGAVARVSGDNLAIAVMDKATRNIISGFRVENVPPRQEVVRKRIDNFARIIAGGDAMSNPHGEDPAKLAGDRLRRADRIREQIIHEEAEGCQ